MIELNVNNESGSLQIVVLGIPDDFGGTPKLEECYDPKSKQHIVEGTFPQQLEVTQEMNFFLEVLKKYDVEVFRPKNIKGLNQIFVRDISFVIGDKLIVPNIIEDRLKEIEALTDLFESIKDTDIIRMPDSVRVEGGDVMPWNDYIFVGYSKEEDFKTYKVSRTNAEGVSFLQDQFSDKIVKSFELNKSDTDPKENALHLDCCFQPFGVKNAIMYKGGFKNEEDTDFLVNLFSEENIIFISKEEMYQMNSNIFSISEKVIVSEKGFTRLNNELRNRGFIVEEIQYSQIAKMEGLLRCSTMPLKRK